MNNKIEKVLVVGGAGYIGGSVTDILMERNIPFSVYDVLLYEHQYLKPVDFIYGDVRDVEKLKKILPNYSHIIWLSAIVGDAACQIKPELTVQINRDSVKWLCENYDGKIVFTSTCSVYGQNNDEVTEDSLLNPLSLYAKTKMEAEEFLKNKNSIIFRLGTVFGVSDSYSRIRMDLVVNYITAKAIKDGKISIFNGNQWRPLIHVYNVAEAIVNSLEKDVVGTFNISTLNYQIKELGKEVSKITGCNIEYINKSFEDSRNYHVSVDKAKKQGLLSFKKIFSVKDGSKQISDLIKSGRLKYAENDLYFNERHIANLNINGKI